MAAGGLVGRQVHSEVGVTAYAPDGGATLQSPSLTNDAKRRRDTNGRHTQLAFFSAGIQRVCRIVRRCRCAAEAEALVERAVEPSAGGAPRRLDPARHATEQALLQQRGSGRGARSEGLRCWRVATLVGNVAALLGTGVPVGVYESSGGSSSPQSGSPESPRARRPGGAPARCNSTNEAGEGRYAPRGATTRGSTTDYSWPTLLTPGPRRRGWHCDGVQLLPARGRRGCAPLLHFG